jgi:KDO2-lipid IV(A) lauroyltransferase
VKTLATRIFPLLLREKRADETIARERADVGGTGANVSTDMPSLQHARGRGAFLRKRASDLWLNLLFWQARRNPAFLCACRPLFLWAAWKFAGQMRHNALCNSHRLLGDQSGRSDREALAKAIIGSFYDFVCDVGKSAGMTRRQLLGRIHEVHGHDCYRAARAEKKGAIILTAHMGSFEVGMAALLEYEKRLHVLFRRDELRLFEQTRSSLRKRLGVLEAPVDDGLAVWIRLRDALAADEVVLIQGDRVMPGQKGRAMPILGGNLPLPTGPVRLALVTGAPIVPVFSIRRPDGQIELFIEPPIRVPDGRAVDSAFKQVAAVLAKYLRRYPQQWLMIRRAWCEDCCGN